MIERNQVMFGVVWPALIAVGVVVILWRAWPRGAGASFRGRAAGALATAAAVIVAVYGLLGGLSMPPERVGPAVALAAALAAVLALIPGRGWTIVLLGGLSGLLATAAVAWPWLAAGRERSPQDLGILAVLVVGGIVFAALTRAICKSDPHERRDSIAAGLLFGLLTGLSVPFLAVGGAWTNAALVAGAGALGLLACVLSIIRVPHHALTISASVAVLGGVLPALWAAAHLGSELPWWTAALMALSPLGWLGGSVPTIAKRGWWLRTAIRLLLVAALASTALGLALSKAPLDSYMEYGG